MVHLASNCTHHGWVLTNQTPHFLQLMSLPPPCLHNPHDVAPLCNRLDQGTVIHASLEQHQSMYLKGTPRAHQNMNRGTRAPKI